MDLPNSVPVLKVVEVKVKKPRKKKEKPIHIFEVKKGHFEVKFN